MSSAVRTAELEILASPFPPSEIESLPRWLRPYVREYAQGETINWCEVIAVAVGTRAALGDVKAAHEIYRATEGRMRNVSRSGAVQKL